MYKCYEESKKKDVEPKFVFVKTDDQPVINQL